MIQFYFKSQLVYGRDLVWFRIFKKVKELVLCEVQDGILNLDFLQWYCY